MSGVWLFAGHRRVSFIAVFRLTRICITWAAFSKGRSLFITAAGRKKQDSPSIMNGVQPPASLLGDVGGGGVRVMEAFEQWHFSVSFFVLSFHYHLRPAMILKHRITQTCSLMVLNLLMLEQINHLLDFELRHMKLTSSALVPITRTSSSQAAEKHGHRRFDQLHVTSDPFHWSRWAVKL